MKFFDLTFHANSTISGRKDADRATTRGGHFRTSIEIPDAVLTRETMCRPAVHRTRIWLYGANSGRVNESFSQHVVVFDGLPQQMLSIFSTYDVTNLRKMDLKLISTISIRSVGVHIHTYKLYIARSPSYFHHALGFLFIFLLRIYCI